jgi:hypothetical protein
MRRGVRNRVPHASALEPSAQAREPPFFADPCLAPRNEVNYSPVQKLLKPETRQINYFHPSRDQ